MSSASPPSGSSLSGRKALLGERGFGEREVEALARVEVQDRDGLPLEGAVDREVVLVPLRVAIAITGGLLLDAAGPRLPLVVPIGLLDGDGRRALGGGGVVLGRGLGAKEEQVKASYAAPMQHQ